MSRTVLFIIRRIIDKFLSTFPAVNCNLFRIIYIIIFSTLYRTKYGSIPLSYRVFFIFIKASQALLTYLYNIHSSILAHTPTHL